MDWIDRDQAAADVNVRKSAARPPGCRGLVVTFLVVVVVFILVAIASGWVHITKVGP
jgi:hypothetical protein